MSLVQSRAATSGGGGGGPRAILARACDEGGAGAAGRVATREGEGALRAPQAGPDLDLPRAGDTIRFFTCQYLFAKLRSVGQMWMFVTCLLTVIADKTFGGYLGFCGGGLPMPTL